MHLIPIEDQPFDFTINPVRVDVFCNGHSVATVERDNERGDWRFWYAGTVHFISGTIDEAVEALKRMHAEKAMTTAAVKAIGQYVAEHSAKLFGEES